MTSPYSAFKRALIGRPIATAQESEERLSKTVALAVFSSDAISSTAYATEEILLALVLAGAAAAVWALPVAAGVSLLLIIVAISYQQTIHAYPSGGGSYIVASENLGLLAGLVAAGSLMVDYVMTVAVSVASGVAAITSAFPSLYSHRVVLAVAVVFVVALANLRGVRESGRLFAVPTYSFILFCGGMVVVGTIRWLTGGLHPIPAEAGSATHALTLFLVLRAFAGGCSAMTGTEAISNGVPAFKKPESRNASITLGIMAAVLAFLFIGVTNLSHVIGVLPKEGDTVLSQIGRAVYGSSGFLYYGLQIATMAILFLGANTSFAGFPRLASILAQDGFLPRQLANRGDRLVYSNGIVGLALVAAVLLVVFGASTHSMIPLYAVGVFVSFTLSQSGMVRHWWRLRGSGWRRRAAVNGFGAIMTGIVAIVIVSTKFLLGAWIVAIAIPGLVLVFYAIRHHYRRVQNALEPHTASDIDLLSFLAQAPARTTVVVLVSQVNQLVARALSYARGMNPSDIKAVNIKGDDRRLERLSEAWARLRSDVPLTVVESPYRELTKPVVAYVRSLNPGPDHTVTVVIPEFVAEHWWEVLLHNQDALRLKGALLFVPWVAVISIPYRMGKHDVEAPDQSGGRFG
jgi:amino acid transporter